MKFTAAILATAGVTAAASISDFVPQCAVKCLEDGVTSGTPCAADDLNCVCEPDNYRATYTAALACVLSSCGSDTAIGEVLPGAVHMCEVVLSTTFDSTAPSSTAPAPSSSITTEVPASTTATATATATTDTTLATPAATTAATTSAVTTDKSSAPSSTSSVAVAGAAHLQQGIGMVSGLVFAILAWI